MPGPEETLAHALLVWECPNERINTHAADSLQLLATLPAHRAAHPAANGQSQGVAYFALCPVLVEHGDMGIDAIPPHDDMVPTNPLPRCVDDRAPHLLRCLLCELGHSLQDFDALPLAVQVGQQEVLLGGGCEVSRRGRLNFLCEPCV